MDRFVIPNNDIGTVTRDTINDDIEECRSGLEHVWIRWCLSDMEDYGTVVLNSVGIVEL